jgi:hypothetical protein
MKESAAFKMVVSHMYKRQQYYCNKKIKYNNRENQYRRNMKSKINFQPG